MNFKTKIFLATLSILVTTLILNSVMSIVSFEKNYVESLISTYEVAGGALKGKIEQSLKFGKPLDKFQGMEALFEKTGEQNRHISMIRINSSDGRLLYEYIKPAPGENVSPPGLEALPFTPDQPPQTARIDNHYVTVFSLKNGFGNNVGRLYLCFPENVIFKKVKEMIISNLNLLWPIVMTTSFCLMFLLAFLIFRPLKKELSHISDLFTPGKDTAADMPVSGTVSPGQSTIYGANLDIHQVKNEIDMLKNHIIGFLKQSSKTNHEIAELNRRQKRIFDCAALLEQNNTRLERLASDLKRTDTFEEVRLLEAIIKENRHIREMLFLIRHMTGDLENVCSRDPFECPADSQGSDG